MRVVTRQTDCKALLSDNLYIFNLCLSVLKLYGYCVVRVKKETKGCVVVTTMTWLTTQAVKARSFRKIMQMSVRL